MRRHSGAAALLAASLCTPPLSAAAPLPLEPSGAWTYSDDGDICVAKRSFGAGARAVDLSIQKYGPSRSFQLRAAGHPLRLRKRASVSLRFEPDETSHVHPEAWIGVDPAGRASFMVNESLADTQERRRRSGDHLTPEPDPSGLDPFWPSSEERREASIERLTFSGPIFTPVTLHIGSMREPMAAIRHCLEKHLTAWGLDLAVQASIVRAVQPLSVARWLTANDYPGGLLLNRKSGIVKLRLLVDRNGTPTDCRVMDPDPPEEFNRLTCSLVLQRARFKPAMAANGLTVDSAFFVTVNWLA